MIVLKSNPDEVIIADKHVKYGKRYILVSYQEYSEILASNPEALIPDSFPSSSKEFDDLMKEMGIFHE